MSGIDNGEEKIERVTSQIAQSGAQVAIQYVSTQMGHLTKAVVSKGLRMGVSSLQWTAAAAQKPGGQVSMKELTELPSQTGREVVSLDDKDVMHALEKNLKTNGVHYAIERENIGGQTQYTLHVRGDDAKVVEHSLKNAAETIDAKRERVQDRQPAQKPERTADAPKLQKPEPKPDLAKKPEKAAPTYASKRTKAEQAKFQKELREKVTARAAKIKAEAPKTVPTAALKIPVPGLKR